MQKRDIVVIGAGLTGLSTAFNLKKMGRDVLVLEKQNRIGGQIATHNEDGFTFESGPNTGVVSFPEVTELFRDLEGRCQMETARESSKRRLIWKGTEFHALPASLPAAVDPFVSGVYAGDPMKLTTRYALPKLYNLEANYGSFVRGAIAKAKEPKSERDRLATKKVFSAFGGLQNLVEALAEGIDIVTGAQAITVMPDGEHKWLIRYNNGTEEIHCNHVITTVGAYALSSLLPFVAQEQMAPISKLYYAPIIQVCVGIKNTGGIDYAAFGGLVPSKEQKKVLGILFPSACFVQRAPEGGALYSYFMGGARHTDYLQKSDAEIRSMVREAFHSMLKYPMNVEPDMIRIFRHEHAIPQYGVDSGERFKAVEAIQQQYPGLIIAGNLRDGIGMGNRIQQAAAIARLFQK